MAFHGRKKTGSGSGLRGARGGTFRSARGGVRGVRRSRGGGTEKNTFYSTRVEEQPQEGKAEESESDVGVDAVTEASDISSNSEDDDLTIDGTRPYNALLLSLSASIHRGEPQRKRKRVETYEAETAPEVADEDLDKVEEPDLVEDLEVDADSDVNEIEEIEDPFITHFSDQDEATLARSIQDMGTWGSSRGKPLNIQGWYSSYQGGHDRSGVPTTGSTHAIKGTNELHLKEKLKVSAGTILPQFDDVSASLAVAMFNYKDIFFPERSLDNAELLRNLSCLHSLNHLFKTRDKVIKNNARLARDLTGEDLELRDQGFTRPKVLIILPTRQSCVRYVETIVSLCEPEQQENKKRFQDSYANGEDNFSEDKPADFRELFAGNDDDMFRLGIKFTRKTIKYFSQFYNSDIIFASPLGLRMALGADDPKKQDHDFLSSIEVVIVDQADAIAMQNWEHIEYIFAHLNLQPKETHGCDFSRVRHWYLDGKAKHLRQTILLSAFNFPTLNKMYSKDMLNVAGKIKYNKRVEGVIVDTGLSSKQTFSRFEYKTPITEPSDRFKYFSVAIVPSLTKHAKSRAGSGQGTLIYIPSYADFVRVRNFLASSPDTQDVSFGSISEYTSIQEVARARSHFASGRHSVLLYTERAHHFRRYHLKGVKKVVMYALPENPVFYKEVAGEFLQSSIAATKITAREANVRALFSRLDVMKLERIVGSSRYMSMLKEKGGDTFDFE